MWLSAFSFFGEAEIIDSPHYTFFLREDGVGGLNKRKGEEERFVYIVLRTLTTCNNIDRICAFWEQQEIIVLLLQLF
jgi:hypothetical protein